MVVVAFAIDPFSLRQVLLFLLSLAHLEHLFNKQGLKGLSPDKPAYLHGLKPRELAAGSSLSYQSCCVLKAPGPLLREPPYLTTTSPHYAVNRGNAHEGVPPLSGASRSDREALCEQ